MTTQPLRPANSPQEVYRSTTPITVPAGQTVTVQARYNQPPVIEAAASLVSPPAGVSISGATFYAWGAEVSIQNTGGSTANVTLVINGKPLSVQGGEQVIASGPDQHHGEWRPALRVPGEPTRPDPWPKPSP